MQIKSISIVSGGTGYTSAPKVTIVGGAGRDAHAVAVVKDGKVVAVNVTNGGCDFTDAKPGALVVFEGGGGSGAVAATNVGN